MGVKVQKRKQSSGKNFCYFVVYKPYGMLSQFSKEGEKPTLADLGFAFPRDAYPVGRLDHDSEGLLLITNDKSLNSKLLSPKNHYKKTYWVQLDREISDEAIEQLQKGVIININGEYKTRPAIVNRIVEPTLPERIPPIRFRVNVPTSWIEISITEGKNRQVRKMTAAVGFPTLRLIRSAIGPLYIDNMNSGDVKILEEAEIATLFY